MFDKNKIDLNNIENSYEYIIECLNKVYMNKVIHYLIENNIDLNIIFDYLDKNNINIKFNVVAMILNIYRKEDVIKKHLNYFCRNNKQILEFKKIVNGYVGLKELNNYITKNTNIIIEEISNLSIYKLKEEKLYDFFKELIKELIEKENVDYDDIEFIGEGTTSKVFGIGSKILKVGQPKEVFKMKNNKLFLQPLYRKEIKSIINNKPILSIEITEKVDTENITEEDVYYIYKTLRDDGLIWLDHIPSNVGRTLKDNKVYFDGIDYVDKQSTDYITDNNEILPKGSLVIIDNDCIYDAEDFFKTTEYRMFGHCSMYEARYREEKEKNKNK